MVKGLNDAEYCDIAECEDSAVTDLFGYARPDAVIADGARPLLSIEQTKMNPSGHNLPQRFSCLVRACERGVAGVLFYPEATRRTYSDSNVRYANPRVALAQLRMLDLFPESPPSLSLFWPADPVTKLCSTEQEAQRNLADLVQVVLDKRDDLTTLRKSGEFERATSEMWRVIDENGNRISRNASYRAFYPDGLPHAATSEGRSVDPAPSFRFLATDDALEELDQRFTLTTLGREHFHRLARRPSSIWLHATANRKQTDSEHPYPAHLLMVDILYSRTGASACDRNSTMIYEVPLTVATWMRNLSQRPALMRIVDATADIVVLRDAIVGNLFGGPRQVVRLTE